MIFWGIALLLVLLAVAFVVLPLVKADAKQQSDQRLNVKLAALFAVLVPVSALAIYSQLGGRTELSIAEMLRNPDSTAAQRTVAMEQWAAEQPENTQALYLLGSEYMSLGMLGDALGVYQRLYEVTGQHPQVSAQLAQVLFLAEEQMITEEVRRLYQESLALDPTNNTALGLQGIDAFEHKQYADAVRAWQSAMSNERDPQIRQALASGIAKAEDMMGKKATQVRVKLDVAPELKSLPADTRVIVFARESGTQGVPVVAVPLTVGELPKEVVLDDSSVMVMGGVLLGDISELDIFARVSLSGDAKSSDYQVAVLGVNPSEEKVVDLKIMADG